MFIPVFILVCMEWVVYALLWCVGTAGSSLGYPELSAWSGGMPTPGMCLPGWDSPH